MVWLALGHVSALADRIASATASRIASSVATDAAAKRPVTISDVVVRQDADGSITIEETVQVHEVCTGDRLDRWAVWPDGSSQHVTPVATSDSWRGGAFSNDLGPGSHRVWVRYRWPHDARPLLYFVRADYRQAVCPSGFRDEYLVLYREMEPG